MVKGGDGTATGVIDSVRGEYGRYRAMAERVFSQLAPDELARRPPGGGNSVATLAWHIAGNLRSRFTDFLTTDGEKPWRDREAEFDPRPGDREAILQEWEAGWAVLSGALAPLDDDDLERTVRIRGVELTVAEALHRSLAHLAYHVGQMVLLGRMARGEDWEFLTIPPGGTEAYNRDPTMERARDLRPDGVSPDAGEPLEDDGG